MDEGLSQQIRTYQHRLDHLLKDGRDLRLSLRGGDGDPGQSLALMRKWQRECAATISQLSGGSKQHWLSRAYSDAFLPRLPGSAGAAAGAVEDVPGDLPVDLIVQRILGVLREAQTSLEGMAAGDRPGEAAPRARRFEFVHDAELRPKLEEAFAAGQAAFDRGEYGVAVLTWASTLEAILTDALQHYYGLAADGVVRRDGLPLAGWPFETRIAAAEEARLISAGCARLPDVARRYRDGLDDAADAGAALGAGERDARLTGQVLRLIMRDLTPGR